jgi:hypothetical protein
VAYEMEWSDVADLYRYWADSPPTHELVAGYLGVKPASAVPAVSGPPDFSGFNMLRSAMSGSKVGVS